MVRQILLGVVLNLMLPGGKRFNSGRFFEGERLDRKLSALELTGQLIGICAGSHILRNMSRGKSAASPICFVFATHK